ncbi:MAG TPA: amidohydrolase [Terriglobales bacterium]|nr:amidohydrolase [Terriglobales bacterium]
MRISILRVVLAIFVFGLRTSAQQPSPDLILINGKIFTGNVSQPYAEALAVRGERIVAVGKSKEVLAIATQITKRINLRGHTVIPGINDAHVHLSVEPAEYDLPLNGIDPTWQEVTDALNAAVSKIPKGEWIDGVFGLAVLDDPYATRMALDAIASYHPVVLWDWTGHASLLNTAAMRKLGIRDDQPDPIGGTYWRTSADGKLTGVALEFASFRVARRFTGLVEDSAAAAQLRKYFDRALRLGITSIQDMAQPIPADRCVTLLAKAAPPLRVRVMWFGLTDEHGRLTAEARPAGTNLPPLVKVSGTKWILDGTPIEHSAAMRQPYSDRPSTSGELNFPQSKIEDMLRDVLRRNDQLMVHVVGDRTIETFFNAMDATGGEKVWAKRRVRLEHGDGLMPDLVPRAKRLGIMVVQNPTHFSLKDLCTERFGPARLRKLFPVRSLLDAGIPVALGSDGPLNPYLNMMLATTHPINPNEALTREQSVIAYTLMSAYAEFAEKDKGSIEPGKLADIAVLSQDIFAAPASDLPKTESVLTIVGGKIVYDSGTLPIH